MCVPSLRRIERTRTFCVNGTWMISYNNNHDESNSRRGLTSKGRTWSSTLDSADTVVSFRSFHGLMMPCASSGTVKFRPCTLNSRSPVKSKTETKSSATTVGERRRMYHHAVEIHARRQRAHLDLSMLPYSVVRSVPSSISASESASLELLVEGSEDMGGRRKRD